MSLPDGSATTLQIVGSSDADMLIVDAVNGLPRFAATFTTPVNPHLTGESSLLFSAGIGSDDLGFRLAATTTDQIYAVGDGGGGRDINQTETLIYNGDEIGAFDGQNGYLDTNGDNNIGVGEKFSTSLRGIPVVGDFNGDGNDDLATFNNNTGVFQFDLNRDGSVDDTLTFGSTRCRG